MEGCVIGKGRGRRGHGREESVGFRMHSNSCAAMQ